MGMCWLVLAPLLLGAEPALARPWARHAIDDASRGADGVKLADANGDGLPDIATGWEEGGVVRIALNPGPRKAKQKWPAVTVGKAGSVEDAAWVDLDGDGSLDVVSSCEGSVKTVFVHWAPGDRARLLEEGVWKTEAIPASRGLQAWMFCVPADLDGKNGVDLVAGGKGPGASVGWFESPRDPRDLAAWRFHSLRKAGWTMSLHALDMDRDGDLDIVLSDRKGKESGCSWLRHPGKDRVLSAPWTETLIGAAEREVMFLSLRDLDRDGLLDGLAAAKPREIFFLRQKAAGGESWESLAIPFPADAGTAKAVQAGDLDLDGRLDLVVTCEEAKGPRWGVLWLAQRGGAAKPEWEPRDLSGPEGTKFDLVELADLDGDGDLDAIACEEAENLGVVWYENPAR